MVLNSRNVRIIVIIFIISDIVLLGGFYLLNSFIYNQKQADSNTQPPIAEAQNSFSSNLRDEQAEIVGFGFVQNFISSAPPDSDLTALNAAYTALSKEAQNNTEKSSRGLAQFVGVENAPDQGASVEDLRVISEQERHLIIGLNYSQERILKNIVLIEENGEWKINTIKDISENDMMGYEN